MSGLRVEALGESFERRPPPRAVAPARGPPSADSGRPRRYARGVGSKTRPRARPLVGPADGVDPRVCYIADALRVVGDRYALLVLREIALGVRRFNDIRVNTGAPRETLTTRLRQLEDAGVIERHAYSQRPPRDEYVLTDAGRAILPVLEALRDWGERYAPHPAGTY